VRNGNGTLRVNGSTAPIGSGSFNGSFYGLLAAETGGSFKLQSTVGVPYMAAGIFAAAGVWQLTGAKDRCLRHCRSPIGLLLHYGGYRGRARDLRVGLHHAAWCLGCCWALMVLFVAFGVMNLLAMVGLAALVLAEKRWSAGERLARLAGVALLALAVVVLFVPGVAPGLTGAHHHMTDMAGTGGMG